MRLFLVSSRADLHVPSSIQFCATWDWVGAATPPLLCWLAAAVPVLQPAHPAVRLLSLGFPFCSHHSFTWTIWFCHRAFHVPLVLFLVLLRCSRNQLFFMIQAGTPRSPYSQHVPTELQPIINICLLPGPWILFKWPWGCCSSCKSEVTFFSIIICLNGH